MKGYWRIIDSKPFLLGFLLLCLFWELKPSANLISHHFKLFDNPQLSQEVNESAPFYFIYDGLEPLKKGRILGIKLGNYGKTLHCKARLRSSEGPLTDWGKCPSGDWDFIALPVLREPSSWPLNLQLETDALPGKGFALATVSLESGNTVDVFTLRTRTTISELISWIEEYPLWVLPWLVLLLVYLKNGYFGNSKFSAVYIVLLMAIGTWPFSGHDETAHITGLHWSSLEASGKSNEEISQAQMDFFPRVHTSLLKYKFDKLHQIKLASPESCPHQLLGSCAYDPSSKTYQTYFAFWKFFGGPDTARWEPETFLIIGRFVNILIFLCFTFFLTSFTPEKYSQAALSTLIICGAFLGQIGSINPEQFGYYAALSGALLLISFTEAEWQLKLKFFICFILFGLFSFYSDPSGLLFIPTAALVVFCYLLGFIPLFKNQKAMNQVTRMVLTMLAACLFLALWFGMRWIFFKLGFDFHRRLLQVPELASFSFFIQNLYGLSLLDTTKALVLFSKSFLGSYTWGHDYYPTAVYLLISASILLSASKSIYSSKSAKYYLLALILGFYLLSILISMIGGPYFHELAVIRDSYLKPRLYGPAALPAFLLVAAACQFRPDQYRIFLKLLGIFFVTTWLMNIR